MKTEHSYNRDNSQEKKTWKNRIEKQIDWEIYSNKEFKQQASKLILCGWTLTIEVRSGNRYLYAIKYTNREKKRIYIGKEKDFNIYFQKKKLWMSLEEIENDIIEFNRMNDEDKIYNLALCGWKIETNSIDGNECLFIVKYVNKKLQRKSLGD